MISTGKWQQVHKKQYRDGIPVEAFQIFDNWVHSDMGSIADNDDKRQVCVYPPSTDMDISLAAYGKRRKLCHWVQVQKGTDAVLTRHFRESACFTDVCKLTAIPQRPYGVAWSVSTPQRNKCRCIKHQSGKVKQCVCTICFAHQFNKKALHIQRAG